MENKYGVKISPTVSLTTATFIEKEFPNQTAGAGYIVDSFPRIYQQTLSQLKGMFTLQELKLIIKAFRNTKRLTPELAGRQVITCCEASIDIDGIDEVYSIDGGMLLDNLRSLEPFQLSCLEVWAQAYWNGGANYMQDVDISVYAGALA